MLFSGIFGAIVRIFNFKYTEAFVLCFFFFFVSLTFNIFSTVEARIINHFVLQKFLLYWTHFPFLASNSLATLTVAISAQNNLLVTPVCVESRLYKYEHWGDTNLPMCVTWANFNTSTQVLTTSWHLVRAWPIHPFSAAYPLRRPH